MDRGEEKWGKDERERRERGEKGDPEKEREWEGERGLQWCIQSINATYALRMKEQTWTNLANKQEDEKITHTGRVILGHVFTSVERTGAKCWGCAGLRGVVIEMWERTAELSELEALENEKNYNSPLARAQEIIPIAAHAQVRVYRHSRKSCKWAWLISDSARMRAVLRLNCACMLHSCRWKSRDVKCWCHGNYSYVMWPKRSLLLVDCQLLDCPQDQYHH